MRALLTTLTLILLPILASAAHTPQGRCDGAGYPALGIIEFTGGSAETTVYVDDRNYLFSNGIWLYIESNGVWSPKALPGVFADDVADHDLQRGMWTTPWPPDDAEICTDVHDMGPDLVVF